MGHVFEFLFLMRTLLITLFFFFAPPQSVASAVMHLELSDSSYSANVDWLFKKVQKRTELRLGGIYKLKPFTPKVTRSWKCVVVERPAIVIPDEKFIFYAPSSKETWIPITGEHKKYQIWAIHIAE